MKKMRYNFTTRLVSLLWSLSDEPLMRINIQNTKKISN